MKRNSRNAWGRVAIAAILSEVSITGLIVLIMVIYRFVIAPGRSDAVYSAFSNAAGYYVAPTAAGLAAFLWTLWAIRRLSSGFVANGLMVGLAGVLLSFGFIFGAEPSDRLMYVVSFVLRIVGGWLGGVVMQRKSLRRSPAVVPA